MVKDTITWIDGAAYLLSKTHCLQENYVKEWIIKQSITSDMIKNYRFMDSLDFLEIFFE